MNQDLFRSSVQAFFEGRATALQKTLIESAMSAPGYRELYFELLEEWECKNPQLITDTEEAFNRLSAHIVAGTRVSGSEVSKNKRFGHFTWLYAASVVLLLTAAPFYSDTLLSRRFETGYGELKSFQLPDGSMVTLNANSTLKLSRFGFGKSERNVFLAGEAEFSVQHLNGNQPFVVRTSDSLEVKVLGTEFVVYSRSNRSKVALNKGMVQLTYGRSEELEPVVMKPGDVILVSDRGELSWQHNQPAEVNTGWKHHRFTFENTSISAIAQQLNELFGVNVIIADAGLAKRTIGGTYQADSAEKVLQILADILEVRILANSVKDESPPTYTLTY